MDKFEDCPCCGSNACIKTITESGETIQLCWTCGFTSNSLLKDGSEFEVENFENTAELIKDLKQTHEGYAWYPKVINLPSRGMIFPEWNKRSKDWYWAAVKAIPIPEEEKENYPDPNNPGSFYEFKMDTSNIKRFNKLEFMDAAEEIGLFNAE